LGKANLHSGELPEPLGELDTTFVTYGQLPAATRASPCQYGASVLGGHTRAEPMSFRPFPIVRLKSTFWHPLPLRRAAPGKNRSANTRILLGKEPQTFRIGERRGFCQTSGTRRQRECPWFREDARNPRLCGPGEDCGNRQSRRAETCDRCDGVRGSTGESWNRQESPHSRSGFKPGCPGNRILRTPNASEGTLGPLPEPAMPGTAASARIHKACSSVPAA
jgi:hypothetical protein